MKKPSAVLVVGGASAGLMKKPAAAAAAAAASPPAEGGASAETQIVAHGGLDAAAVEKVMADAKLRRAAYGRLGTAVSNDARADVLNIYHGLEEVAKKDLKKQQFLVAWLMDPSFAECIVECKILTEHLKTSRNDTRLVTKWQFEQLEGVEEAARLIDEKKVRPTTDQYGRPVFVYSQELASDERKQGMKTGVKMTMDIDAKAAATIGTAMLTEGVGSDWGVAGGGKKGGKTNPNPKPVTDDMKEYRVKKQQLKKTKAAIAKSKMAAVTWKTSLGKSAHPFAKKTKASLEKDIMQLEKFQMQVDDFDTKFVFEDFVKMGKQCDECVNIAGKCVAKADKNIEIASVL